VQHKPTGRKRYKNVAADKLYRQCHGHGSDTAQDRQQTGKKHRSGQCRTQSNMFQYTKYITDKLSLVGMHCLHSTETKGELRNDDIITVLQCIRMLQ